MAGITANLHHLTNFEVKDNIVHLPETAVTRGFEKFAFPKIVAEVQSENLTIRRKSLAAALELLAVSESYVQCLEAGIVPALVPILSHEDALCRERAARCLRYIAGKEMGADAIHAADGVAALLKQLDDAEGPVKDAAYECLLEASRHNVVRAAIGASEKSFIHLVELCLVESDPRVSAGLLILKNCVQVQQNEAALETLIVKARTVRALAQLLAGPRTQAVRRDAATLLGLLCMRDDAKEEAVAESTVPMLVRMLKSPLLELRVAASGALMMVTICKDGKMAMHEADGAIAKLCDLLKEPNAELQLIINVLQAVTSLAEAPECRATLREQGMVDVMTALQERTPSTLVRRCAAHALRQVHFATYPYTTLPMSMSRGQTPHTPQRPHY